MTNVAEFTEIDRLLLKELKRNEFQPAAIYDIGAAKGYWSALVSDDVFPDADYHLFEPLTDGGPYVEHLNRVLAGHPRFTLHRVALGAKNGTADFWMDPDQYGSTALDMRNVPGFTRQKVPMQRLDDYVARQRLPLPDLLKLDVQGFELEILRRATECLKHATALYVEAWLTRGYGPRTPLLHELQAELAEHGFDLLELGDRYYAEGHALASVDVLFVKRAWARAAGRTLMEGDWVYRRAVTPVT